MLNKAERTADRNIYLGEDRFDNVKDCFKLMASELEKDMPYCNSVCDVGGATGEFLYYLHHQFESITTLDNMDIVLEFKEVFEKRLPKGAGFFQKNIESNGFNHHKQYCLVVCAGVMSVFFDLETSMKNLLSLVMPGGWLYLFGGVNPDPVDVHLVYRRVGSAQWETGKNMYSIETIKANTPKDATVEVIDFKLPVAIPKTDDPMRGWTEDFRGNPNHVFYGVSTVSTQKLIKIRKKPL